MTHEFKPGDKATYVGFHEQGGSGHECTILENVEGWFEIKLNDSSTAIVRPSRLTPADPGPDAATLLVRELCAAEWEAASSPTVAECCKAGDYDKKVPYAAFAKYIRANPPPPLTVEALSKAMESHGYHFPAWIAERVIATLTEQRA